MDTLDGDSLDGGPNLGRGQQGPLARLEGVFQGLPPSETPAFLLGKSPRPAPRPPGKRVV